LKRVGHISKQSKVSILPSKYPGDVVFCFFVYEKFTCPQHVASLLIVPNHVLSGDTLLPGHSHRCCFTRKSGYFLLVDPLHLSLAIVMAGIIV
jgi:hypothetical protein